jgi:hypothetical protein
MGPDAKKKAPAVLRLPGPVPKQTLDIQKFKSISNNTSHHQFSASIRFNGNGLTMLSHQYFTFILAISAGGYDYGQNYYYSLF